MSEIALRDATRRARGARPNGAGHSDPDIDAAIVKLAALPALAYDRVRVGEAEALGVRATTLDDAVARARQPKASDDNTRQGAALALARPEPWPDAVEGSALFDQLARTFARYLALPPGAAIALSLWTLHSYAFEEFAITPRLAIVSAEKGSGKTTALRLLQQLACKPLLAAHITPAAMFRTLSLARPTLLIDEADTFVKGNDELRGVINSGHGRDGALIRNVGDDFEPRVFSTWAPVAIAAIGDLPDTVMDRSVVIPMRRRRADEIVDRFRLDRAAAHAAIARRCERFTRDARERLARLDPEMPDWMSDRAIDNWRVLFTIAEAIGPAVVAAASAAARALIPTTGAAPSERTMLLEDIRKIFDERTVARIPSADLVAALVAREDRPWPELKNGQPITPAHLAKLLQPFGVKPRAYWDEAQRSVRGYNIEDLEDSFARYLPPTTVRPSGASNSAPPQAETSVRTASGLTPRNGAEANQVNDPDSLTPQLPLGMERRRMKPGISDD